MTTQAYVLVIEDSYSQALQIKLVLQRAGYDVQVAQDGLSGWRQACSCLPDLVLLDVNLPEMDGFQVLAALKRQTETAHIPVVMLTSEDRVPDVERAVALGADGYLFKADCLRLASGAAQITDMVEWFFSSAHRARLG